MDTSVSAINLVPSIKLWPELFPGLEFTDIYPDNEYTYTKTKGDWDLFKTLHPRSVLVPPGFELDLFYDLSLPCDCSSDDFEKVSLVGQMSDDFKGIKCQ